MVAHITKYNSGKGAVPDQNKGRDMLAKVIQFPRPQTHIAQEPVYYVDVTQCGDKIAIDAVIPASRLTEFLALVDPKSVVTVELAGKPV